MEEHPSQNGIGKEEATLAEPQPEQNNTTNELEVRSNAVQEIIGRPPHWLVRGGIAAFLGVFAMIFLVAAVIKYPEVIEAPLKVTAINAPKPMESKVNGKLVNLLSENGANVEEGVIIAWMESTADHREILDLSARIDKMYRWFDEEEYDKIQVLEMDQFSNLGELQSQYQSFYQVYNEFVTFLPGGLYRQKRAMLKQEIAYNNQLLESLKKQKEVKKVDRELAEKKYNIQKKLREKELSAPLELATAKSKMAGSQLPLLQTETSIINNRASLIGKKKQLIELNKQLDRQKADFRQALNTLQSAIKEWKHKYLLRAPVSGKLVYAGVFQEDQTIKSGERIAYVQPENTQFFGELAVSQRSYGRIQEGQEVLVRFSGFPSREFGSVTAKVDYLSEFPVRDSLFVAKVTFPNGFTTNYDRQLNPTDGMQGRAEIITQDMRFIERIYNNLTKELR
ncbi:HlyD family efflux transporter periplasmic adaptor subunit [Fodinibius halophilus]|uniref:HlyD family efflux transporter periplasmic adaptor subunit n=1 Tax=Fodinibius halophilus TaxID=1736908 RepID=A0A6M1THP8_9BACT|nr:HlyD family efflux transporter periplasmic adaptor subunit [Fodinibius halophilus]NGP90264.1 HlyD family efflux transporter periplasmic adaptor subunit [Fodinibius halophilus]